MKKQVLFLMAIMLNLGVSYGQDIWSNGSGDGKFETDANWNTGFKPEVDPVFFDGGANATNCTVNAANTGGHFRIGIGGTPYGSLIIKNGGKLESTKDHWSAVGWTTKATLIVEAGGIFSTFSHLWLAFNPGAESTISLSGTINVNGMFGFNFENLANASNSSGELTINNGGILNLAQLHPTQSFRGTQNVLKIMGGGTMNVVGDKKVDIDAYVAANSIVAPGGSVSVVFIPGVPDQTPADLGKTVVTSTAAPLSVKDFANLNFTTYPNPATNFININAKSNISNLKIYNNLGQIVKEETNKTGADISELSSGIYMIKVTDESGNLGVNKFIKQ